MFSLSTFKASDSIAVLISALSLAGIGMTAQGGAQPATRILSGKLSGMCTPEAMKGVVLPLGMGITIKQVPNGPQLPGGTKMFEASGKTPAYCQVTGSYVTNPKTGKTANFLATFPETWNGKYLQLGCSGACGFLLMNDPASPPITITAQGYPKQLIEKGYAAFGNDLGHVLPGPSTQSFAWLKAADGTLDVDALDDYLFRADLVMADMGKAFTRAFYAGLKGAPANISRSYFSGCSQGGREALVAATRFPEKFDGIIAGSPAQNSAGILWHGMGQALVAQVSSPAKLTAGQTSMLRSLVQKQCDGLDGVKDGLVQNPAACNFHPTRDVPICKAGEPSDICLSKAQAESVSIRFSGLTDEAGKVLQPGYSVTNQDFGFVFPMPANLPVDADMRFIIGKPFDGQPLAMGVSGGPGSIDAYRLGVNGAAYRAYFDAMRRGTAMPQDFGKLLKNNRKLIWYHNLSDDALTPYMSINMYKQMASLYGGYAKLQKNVRLFAIPNTGHCGMSGNGPGNFDAAGALEAWVEKGIAPDAIMARYNDPKTTNVIMGQVDWSKPAVRTMPLCPFPQMAAYKGTGDISDGANWACRRKDARMLQVGSSGLQAGVMR